MAIDRRFDSFVSNAKAKKLLRGYRGQILDSRVYSFLMKMFIICYKTGVIDAECIGNPTQCEDFKEDVRKPGFYGRVIRGYSMNFEQWKIHLIGLMRAKRCMAGVDFLYLLSGKTFYSCALSVAQEFYIRGMDDYNVRPTIHDFTLFDNAKLQVWEGGKIRTLTRKDVMVMAQEICLERDRFIDDDSAVSKYYGKSFERFSKTLWMGSFAFDGDL